MERKFRDYIPVYILCCVCLIFSFCFHTVITKGPSMEPTYDANDFVLCIRAFREPEVGDIVLLEKDGVLMLKRVAATSGQTAFSPAASSASDGTGDITDCDYFQGLSESDKACQLLRCERMGWDPAGCAWTQYSYWSDSEPAVLPEGYVFVCGDNLSDSYDSRDEDFGLVPVEDIWGYPVISVARE